MMALTELAKIANLEVVHDAKEWRTLIDSLLISRVITNYLLILVTSRTTRNWIDDEIAKGLKIVFNWPRNVSNQIIRVITKQPRTLTVLSKYVKLGTAHNEFGNTFKALNKLIEQTERTGSTKLERIEHKLVPIASKDRKPPGKYPNPMDHLEATVTVERVNRDFFMAQIDGSQYERPAWVIVTKGGTAIGLGMGTNERIISQIVATNTQYSIGYFNQMSLVWWPTGNKLITTKRLIMIENDALYMALANAANHDWRTIELRNRIVNNGWQLIRIRNGLSLKELKKRTMQRVVKPNEAHNTSGPGMTASDGVTNEGGHETNPLEGTNLRDPAGTHQINLSGVNIKNVPLLLAQNFSCRLLANKND